jgi:hypothetical protein
MREKPRAIAPYLKSPNVNPFAAGAAREGMLLGFSLLSYRELVDWTARLGCRRCRSLRSADPGPAKVPRPAPERLHLAQIWWLSPLSVRSFWTEGILVIQKVFPAPDSP